MVAPLLLALALGQFAADLPKDPLAPMGALCVIDKPVWAAAPTGDEMFRLYPPNTDGMPEGQVELGCKVRTDGALGACHVRSETPKGSGFGAATLRLSRYFRLDMAQTHDTHGGPPKGCDVRVPVRWTRG